MLKVFLVEDESIVREGLRESIPWSQYGFEFCGDAPDGEVALPMIRKFRPDILITDIKMPFMDGLELSKLVSAELPDTKIVIISGYNDFQFAREAIEIGVEQYLLKPITKASLLDTLSEMKKKIEEEQEQKDYLRRFQLEAQEYEQFARRKFFEQITSGTLSVSVIYEQAKKLDIDIDAENYNIILFTLLPRSASPEYSQPLAEQMEELTGYFLQYEEYLLFHCNLTTYAVIVKGSAENINEISRRCVENIERRCTGSDETNWYVALSEPVNRLSGLAGCYAQAHQILSYRHLMPEKNVLTADVLVKPEKSARFSGLEQLDAAKVDPMIVRNFLQTGLKEEVPGFVSEYLDSLGPSMDSVIFRQYILLDIRFSAILAAKAFGCPQEEFTSRLEPLRGLEQDSDISDVKKYAVNLLRRAIEVREEESGNRNKTIMTRAVRFIDQNYTDENMSLNTVAKAINVSPNYFSGMFSQEMGQTFIEYLTMKRMELAKQLLRQTSKRSSEIAFKIGYRDPRYFSFIFKKTQGCTPSSYRAGEQGTK